MKDILLIGKKILFDKSPVVMTGTTADNWKEKWQVMAGNWEFCDGCLIGKERGNKGGILFSKDYYEGDYMMSFIASTVLPATRDVNAVFCAKWDKKTDYLGESYVCGLNGWYEHKSGIESNSPNGFCALTKCYHYIPGTEVHMTVGVADGHTFMVVDGEVVTEYKDPNPLKGGHFGFSPYSTMLKIRDIEIRRIVWEKFTQIYTPEF